MFKRKYHLYFTYEEIKLITRILLYKREQLLALGKFTDPVDELLIKFVGTCGQLSA